MATRRKGNSNIMSNNNLDSSNATTTTGRYKTKEISPLEIANDDISSTTNGNTNNTTSTIEEQYKSEREQTKLRHWKESEYAAGLVEPTWADEHYKNQQQGCCTCCCSESSTGGGMGQMFQEEIDPGCGCIFLSALVCSKLNAGRIGNMIILKERYVMVEVDDNEEDEEGGGQEQIDGFVDEEALHQRNNKSNNDTTTEKTKTTTKRLVRKREIQFMLGPFWPMLLFITYPLIFGVSALTLYTAIPGKPWYVQIGWAILTLLLIRALFNTGFRDPGILMRHKNPPPVKDDDDDGNTTRRVGFRWGNEAGPWRWSDLAQSYRPRNSMYCPDCKVIIEEFDHT